MATKKKHKPPEEAVAAPAATPIPAALQNVLDSQDAAEAGKEARRALLKALQEFEQFAPGTRGALWGAEAFTTIGDLEREGLLELTDPNWPAGNEAVSAAMVQLLVEIKAAAERAGRLDVLLLLPESPATDIADQDAALRAAMASSVQQIARGLFAGVLTALEAKGQLAALRRGCEPSVERLRQGGVHVGRRYMIGSAWACWIRKQLAPHRPDTVAASSKVPARHLDPTDFAIIKLMRGRTDRLLLPEIATLLNRDRGPLGRNLANLVRMGILHNAPRKGYKLVDPCPDVK